MLLCAYAHNVEHILIVPLIKYLFLSNKRVIIFYVIIQTILCVYYLQEIVFFLYQLSYLSKPKKRPIEMVKISTGSGFHTANNDA